MQTWTDFERQQMVAMKKETERDLECITCKSCGSQWFEEVRASKYLLEHHLIVGQSVPTKHNMTPYVLLRCMRCGELIEPRIISNMRDVGAKDYDKFIDTMKGKDDAREKKDAVPNEEL